MYYYMIVNEKEQIIKINGDTISFIPTDTENIDYREYLNWLDDGNSITQWSPDGSEV